MQQECSKSFSRSALGVATVVVTLSLCGYVYAAGPASTTPQARRRVNITGRYGEGTVLEKADTQGGPVASSDLSRAKATVVPTKATSDNIINDFDPQHLDGTKNPDGSVKTYSLHGILYLMWNEIQNLNGSRSSLATIPKLQEQVAELTKQMQSDSQLLNQMNDQLRAQNAELTKRIDTYSQSYTRTNDALKAEIAELTKRIDAMSPRQNPAKE